MKQASSRILVITVCISLVCFLTFLEGAHAAYSGNSHRELDICSHWNGRRHFLELGERGDLHARNVTTSAYRSTLYTPLNIRNRTNADIWYQCNLELVTCAECVIRITFTYVNFSKTCERITNSGVGGKAANMCPCEHIQFSEPPYDTTISGQEFCGDGKVFRSKTRTLLLKFFYRATNSHVFSLQYFSERNVKIISGSPTQSIVSNYSQFMPQIISTPYFPMSYPRDYGIEHILTCEADNCQVRLEFTDFQLGLTSTLEVFDSNGQMLDSYTGEHFRPPIIISSGKSLLLQFRGNGVTGSGYRAEVSFVSAKQLKERQLVPYTDCGGMVSGPGGAITMMNMIENKTDVRLYDCIWIIKPGNNYMMMKTHISLRVEAFYGMASRSDLTIRQGTTSDAPGIENVVWPNNGMSKESHIVPILTGYYIRLRGVFGMSSKLAIVYSVFNYLNCYIGSEFLCNNNHCISIRLHCDGFDHCGDGSDEPESCEEDWAHLQNDRRWYSNKPNYYFPKMEQYPDLKTATGIFVMSTLGIFAVLSGWMVILYRMGVRARHQRELQNHLQTISELLDRQEELTTDEPPDYEAPPDYEEVIKIGMEQEIHESRQRQRRHRRHHHDQSRSRSNGRMPTNTGNSLQPGIHTYGPSTSSAAAATTSDSSPMDNPLQELATRVLTATTACDLAEPNAERQCRCTITQPMGAAASATSISIGGELPSSSSEFQGLHQQQPQQPSSSGTPTQFEECSNEFRDESLNISFTLAIPQTLTASDGKSQRPKSNICTENTYLKRSWVVFNNGNQNFRVQRLRHTFSSPETFLTDFLPPAESLNYGTNLPIERNSYISNASIFGSELSRDPSPTSDSRIPSITSNQIEIFTQYNQDSTIQTPDSAPDYNSTSKSLAERSSKADQPSCSHNKHRSSHSSGSIPFRFELEPIEANKRCHSDSENNNPTFCFGNVNNPFRVSNKKRNTHQRRHTRSKSFTNAGSRQRVTRLRRTSSADLLLQRFSPKKERNCSRIYLI